MTVKARTGGAVMQNPSDPDATYDGHKGPGYQVQIAETCHPDNEVQLITCALPQTAAARDEEAVAPVLQDLRASQLLPEQVLADTSYTSDDNVRQAERCGVELVGPVPGTEPNGRADDLSLDDFVIDETTECVTCCPDGQAPVTSVCAKMREFVRAKAQAAAFRTLVWTLTTDHRGRPVADGCRMVVSVFSRPFPHFPGLTQAA